MAEQDDGRDRRRPPGPEGTSSEFSGLAGGDVVQARDISGGIHFHRAGVYRGPVPRQLPAAVRDFTGRSADLLALDALLPAADQDRACGRGQQPGAVVVSAIGGAAGIGKTTLAVYWAHRVRDRFPDGTLYTNLRGYGPGLPAAPGEVLEGFLRALGVAPGRIPPGTGERAALYRSLLAARRVLVVLDNANAPEQVRPLLPASQRCLALVTSRSSMTGLAISDGAVRVSLDLLAFDEASDLLAGIVGMQRGAAEPEAVTDVVRACARLPLALRIAGQRAASRPHLRLADVAAELAIRRDRLDVLSCSGDELTMVRAVFDWSYQALPPDQARLFCLLGLHPGVEISVHAAAALADTDPQQVRSLLESLADVHLAEPAAAGRYKSHDLLRDYALQQAERHQPAEEIRLAMLRLMGFYLDTAHSVDKMTLTRSRPVLDAAPAPRHRLAFASRQEATGWFRAEQENLVAAAQHAAAAGMHAVSWQFSAVLNVLVERHGHTTDWITTLQAGLASARKAGSRDGERYLLGLLSEAYEQLSRPADALQIIPQEVRLDRELGDPEAEFWALVRSGSVHCGLCQPQDAISCIEQALSLRDAPADPWKRAVALNILGEAYRAAGRAQDAVRCHREALPVFSSMDAADRKCWTLLLLGDALLILGRVTEAITNHERALDISRELQSFHRQGPALESLGNDHHASGETPKAIAYWKQALAIYDQTGRPQADALRARLEAMHPLG